MAVAVKVTFDKLQGTAPADLFYRATKEGKAAVAKGGLKKLIPHLHLELAGGASDAEYAVVRVAGRDVVLPKNDKAVVDNDVFILIQNRLPGIVEATSDVLSDSDAVAMLRGDLEKAHAKLVAAEDELVKAQRLQADAEALRADAEGRERAHSDRVVKLEGEIAVLRGRLEKAEATSAKKKD